MAGGSHDKSGCVFTRPGKRWPATCKRPRTHHRALVSRSKIISPRVTAHEHVERRYVNSTGRGKDCFDIPRENSFIFFSAPTRLTVHTPSAFIAASSVQVCTFEHLFMWRSLCIFLVFTKNNSLIHTHRNTRTYSPTYAAIINDNRNEWLLADGLFRSAGVYLQCK